MRLRHGFKIGRREIGLAKHDAANPRNRQLTKPAGRGRHPYEEAQDTLKSRRPGNGYNSSGRHLVGYHGNTKPGWTRPHVNRSRHSLKIATSRSRLLQAKGPIIASPRQPRSRLKAHVMRIQEVAQNRDVAKLATTSYGGAISWRPRQHKPGDSRHRMRLRHSLKIANVAEIWLNNYAASNHRRYSATTSPVDERHRHEELKTAQKCDVPESGLRQARRRSIRRDRPEAR